MPQSVLSAEDRLDIRQLVDSYAVNADRRDGYAVADLFAPGASMLIFDTGDLEAQASAVRTGREQLSIGPRSLEQFAFTAHFVGQQVIVPVDADNATGTVYCIASHVFDDANGNRMNTVVNLRYFDRYVRHEGAWMFAERRLSFDFLETRPVGGHFPGSWTR